MYFPNVFRATASVDARVRSTLFRARIRRRHRRIAARERRTTRFPSTARVNARARGRGARTRACMCD